MNPHLGCFYHMCWLMDNTTVQESRHMMLSFLWWTIWGLLPVRYHHPSCYVSAILENRSLFCENYYLATVVPIWHSKTSSQLEKKFHEIYSNLLGGSMRIFISYLVPFFKRRFRRQGKISRNGPRGIYDSSSFWIWSKVAFNSFKINITYSSNLQLLWTKTNIFRLGGLKGKSQDI